MGYYIQTAMEPTANTVESELGILEHPGIVINSKKLSDAWYKPCAEDIKGKVEDISQAFQRSIWSVMNFEVRGLPFYRNAPDSVYRIAFPQNQRNAVLDNRTIEGLCEYAFTLGQAINQNEIYVEFNGQRLVFRLQEGKFEGEDLLKVEADKSLRDCRPNWDVVHAEETVKEMEALVQAEGGNRRVLVATAWLHDTGYGGLFRGKTRTSIEYINAQKALHMERGPKLSMDLLTRLRICPKNEIEMVAQLISMHDDMGKIECPYGQIVMEADTTAQARQSRDYQLRGISNFSPEDQARFWDCIRNNRRPLFKTKTGIQRLDEILAEVK